MCVHTAHTAPKIEGAAPGLASDADGPAWCVYGWWGASVALHMLLVQLPHKDRLPAYPAIKDTPLFSPFTLALCAYDRHGKGIKRRKR